MSHMSTTSGRAAHAAPMATRTTLEPVDDRSAHRFTLGGAVTCNAGKIVNLSTSGALVTSRKPLGSELPFVVSDGAVRVTCTAKVVRTWRLGEHRHNCALSFADLTPENEAAIEFLIARHHLHSEHLRREAA
jgi:hypothetical protein